MGGLYIYPEEYLCVTSAVDNPTIRDFRFANLKCKDAIVDRIKKKVGRRPDSGSERTGAVVDLYWKGGLCLVYLDTSGEPLYRRGYRKIPLHAPMQETLAAAVIQATGWRGRGNFVNPMCGSGTLAIEAALAALEMAPGLLRKNFGFMHLKGFNRASCDKMLQEARARVKKSFPRRLRNDPFANDFVVEQLERRGIRCHVAGVAEYMQYSDHMAGPLRRLPSSGAVDDHVARAPPTAAAGRDGPARRSAG